MLTVTLATWLLATASIPVEAQLELSPDGNDHLALRLCFNGQQTHQLHYRLEVKSSGPAGTSRTRQSGKLASGNGIQCPISNRLSAPASGSVEATLEWSIDGRAQPTLQQSYPVTQPTSPVPQPQSPQPDEHLHEAGGLVAWLYPPHS